MLSTRAETVSLSHRKAGRMLPRSTQSVPGRRRLSTRLTAYSRRSGDHETTLILVCDRCGHAVNGADLEIADFRLFWGLVASTGWRGLDRPLGPHFCPGCPNGSEHR
jgi:hypothetical protein